MEDSSKGVRKDGVFCFLLQFDLCDKNDCFCERPPIEDAWSDSRVKYGTYLAREFEEIENEE